MQRRVTTRPHGRGPRERGRRARRLLIGLLLVAVAAAGTPSASVLAEPAPLGAGTDEPSASVPPSAEVSPGFVLLGTPTPVTVTVHGVGTTFDATTAVQVFADSGHPLGPVGRVVVAGPTTLTFDIVQPLPAGNYTVRTATPTDGTITDSVLIVGRGRAELSPSTLWLPVEEATLAVEVFDGQISAATTVEVRDEYNRIVSDAVTAFEVLDPTHARLTMRAGLAAGGYDVRFSTEGLQVRSDVTVQHPVLEITPQDLPVGYTGQRFEVRTVGMVLERGHVRVQLLDATGEPVKRAIRRLRIHADDRLSFHLTRGLPPGDYTLSVRSGDAAGSGLLLVSRPHAFLEPDALDVGYPPSQVGVVGTHTTFRDGTTTVEIVDATGAPSSVTPRDVTVQSPTALMFTLDAGLPAGGYELVVTTGDQRVTVPLEILAVGGAPEVFPHHLRPGAASASFAIVRVFGGDRLVRGGTALELLGPDGNVVVDGVRRINVLADQVATFEFGGGLAAGTYGLRVRSPEVDRTVPVTVGPPAVDELGLPPDLRAGHPVPLRFTVVGAATDFVDDVTTVTVHDATGAQVGEGIRPVVDNGVSLSGHVLVPLPAGTYVLRVTTGSEVVEATFEVPASAPERVTQTRSTRTGARAGPVT